ncbi:porin [Leptospira sp. GIMC2001]|uniref:porin n=1 Tax=Leptospira sp. GIMC2001 TaxID=1513297 RepID=UPI00234AD215|nr:porin [Leptospira sp. GIMC2001]WCL49411.1 porin [Leptospira sp. GIMC2001]
MNIKSISQTYSRSILILTLKLSLFLHPCLLFAEDKISSDPLIKNDNPTNSKDNDLENQDKSNQKSSSEEANDSKKPEENLKNVSESKKAENSLYAAHWFTSRMGEGFTITSDDAESLINIRIRAQLRASQTVVPEDRSKDSTTFQARRLRLMARGKLRGDEWHYYVQFGFSNLDNEPDRPVPLRDSVILYNGFKSVKISVGQMKVPFNRQRVNSSSALQMVDRSIVNGELTLDRDAGIQIFTNDLFGLWDKVGINVGVFGGDGRNRTTGGNGVLTVAKISYFPFGNFLQNKLAGVDDELLSEGDFKRHKTPKLAISFGAGQNNQTRRDRSTFGNVYEFARFDYTHGLAELLVKWMGFSFSTEFISRKANLPYQEREINGVIRREYSRSAYGYFFQMGYLFENNWEVSTRWGQYTPWGETNPQLQYSREAGVGLSYYFSKHNLKWQMDYFKLDGDPTLVVGSHEIRTQLQLFY